MGRKPKHPRDSYGAWLHHLRKESGMSQQELADTTGIHQRMISYWERTGRLAGRKEIFALAKAFKVSVSDLLREKHERSKGIKPTKTASKSVQKPTHHSGD